ncbi:WD40-repeat-containing domain protein, partial [Mycena floridula]
MASTSSSAPSCAVVFTTQTPYPLPSQKFMIPTSWKRYQLSQLVNKALSLAQPVPFDFLVRGELLSASLGHWCTENGVGEEETLEIEYIESVLPPQKISDLPHEDWVSSVSCKIPGYFVTASYDGNIRIFDYSQNVVSSTRAHSAAVTSVCVVSSEDQTPTIASASHDLTAQIQRLSFQNASESKVLATLHLHTSALSSIASNSTGTHLLTSSWDGLIGLWDTKIPSQDEVPDVVLEGERKKRRKITEDAEKPKRKAPLTVLKSHTDRVSRVIFGNKETGQGESTAYSCGFDSTVRTWDVENGVCTNTITVSEKPFLDVTLISDGNTALAASTDRTVTIFDLRTTGSTTSVGSMMHPATPSCIALATESSHQVMTGAYDGVVRLWDVRSLKGAIMSFKAWEGKKKVLAVDWQNGIAGVGGEGGLEVWRAGED